MTTKASHHSFRFPPPKCPTCGKSLPSTAPRVQVGHLWYDEDCAYLLEHPDAARVTRAHKPKVPQTETLL